MTDNPEYGTVLYDLLRKAERGDAAPLDAYLAADPTRAASADRSYLLAVRHQYGRSGRAVGTAIGATCGWPGTPTRTALVVLRGDARGARSWHELVIPAGTQIESIRADGSTFRIRVNGDDVTTTGDEVFRVSLIARLDRRASRKLR